MKNLNYFFALMVVYLVSAENCDKHGVLIYEDVKCKPVNGSKGSCPASFDCDFARSKSGCLFKGRVYNAQEEIPADLTYSSCNIGCRCQESSVLCAVLDCPEHLGVPFKPGCYPKHELGKCCSTGSICEDNAPSKTCQVDGNTYKVGQRFYPKNSCSKCICHDKFTGKYDEQTCERINCASELRDSDKIRNKCAPAYFKFGSDDEVLCCPNEWICPEESDNIEVISSEKNGPEECLFGSKKIPLGKGLRRSVEKYGSVRKLVCECSLPPLLTCKEV